MAAACERHPSETAEAVCGRCGHGFCVHCLVFPFGPTRPPLCVACALTASGVRSTAARTPKLSRRDLKAQRKAERLASKGRGPVIDPLPAPADEIFVPLDLDFVSERPEPPARGRRWSR